MIWCLHGNIGLPADWDILSSELSPFKGEVIRKVDLWRFQECRSIGLVEFGEIFSSEVAAQDQAPILIGYSMGARLALHAMSARPDLWKAVVLISAHPGLKDKDEQKARLVSDAEWSAKALSKDWGRFLAEWNDQTVLGEVPDGLSDRYLLQPRAQSVARAFNAWSLGGQEDFREKVTDVMCPARLIVGEEDWKYRSLASELQLPNASIEVIPKAKHRPLWEQPSATLDVMKRFMQEI